MFVSAGELLNLAMGIERSGFAYYDSLIGSTRNEAAKDAYRYLADQEREHLAIFQEMLGRVGDYVLPDTYTEDYDLYMKSLVDSSVFTSDRVARDMAEKAGSDAEAIQMAIGAEKDSILLYTEIRELVRRQDADVLKRIIEEERSHLRQLSAMKGDLTGRVI